MNVHKPRDAPVSYSWKRHDPKAAATTAPILPSATFSPRLPPTRMPQSPRSPTRPPSQQVMVGEDVGLAVSQISPLAVSVQSMETPWFAALDQPQVISPPHAPPFALSPAARPLAVERFIGRQQPTSASASSTPLQRGRGLGTQRSIPAKHLAPQSWQCAICLGSRWADVQLARLVNCNHTFHSSCVDKWTARGQGECPCCRQRYS